MQLFFMGMSYVQHLSLHTRYPCFPSHRHIFIASPFLLLMFPFSNESWFHLTPSVRAIPFLYSVTRRVSS